MIKKAKVLRYHYSEKDDSIFWEVQPEGEKESQTLFWKRESFGPSFKVYYNVPVKLAKEFSENMIGKTVDLDIGAAGDYPDVLANKLNKLKSLADIAVSKGDYAEANKIKEEIEKLQK